MKTPHKVPAGPTVFFDVDDTLVMWDLPKNYNSKDVVEVTCKGLTDVVLPNHHNIDLLVKMSKRGHEIIVWSASGSDWAEAVVSALDLNAYVNVVMSKPTYYIDDIQDPAKILGKHGYFTLEGKRYGHSSILTEEEN